MKPLVPVVVVFRSSPAITNEPAPFQTALHKAARENDTKALKRLVQQDINLTTTYSKGNSPLHTASYHGSVDFIQELSRSMSPEAFRRMVNQTNEYGSTPLHSAAKKGHVKAIELLLNLGADPTIRDHSKRTPSDLALSKKFTKAAEILRDFKPSQDTFTLSEDSSLKRLSASNTPLSKSTSNTTLNPFAQPFSPSNTAHHFSDDDLQLPTTEELADLLGIQDPDTANADGAALSQPELPPITPTHLRRLNVFTGVWGDPFLPQETEKFALDELSILNQIKTTATLEEGLPSSRLMTRNSSRHNIFIGHSDPFTPIQFTDRPETTKANPFRRE